MKPPFVGTSATGMLSIPLRKKESSGYSLDGRDADQEDRAWPGEVVDMGTRVQSLVSDFRNLGGGMMMNVPECTPLDSSVSGLDQARCIPPAKLRQEYLDLLELVGHGCSQLRILFCAHLSLVMVLFHDWSTYVLTRPVDHWCKPPALFAHLTRDQWLNVSVPVVEDSQGNRHHSQCAMYDLSTIVFNGSRLEVPCDGWDYDLPADASTVVSKSFQGLLGRRCQEVLFHDWSTYVLTRPVDHWCKPPALFAHLTRDQWLNVSVPVVEDSQGNRHHSQCAMYDLSTIVFNGSRLEVPCDGWDYDLPADASTVVSK
ncbi:hypothetical protein HPB51_007024 [Rhipicephalus microplus]|uniref:Uncharacterized protein n=1 Tax=Rhipicephalus microplus TaxID=6941 RepID=A0A9J6DZ32_RHIMP|nr:hypothetical protein HPB51_007024 [Rhipicephalus microplus]